MSNQHNNGIADAFPGALPHPDGASNEDKRRARAAQDLALPQTVNEFKSLAPAELFTTARLLEIHRRIFGAADPAAGRLRDRPIRLAWHIPPQQTAAELERALRGYCDDCLTRVKLTAQKPAALAALLGFAFWKLVYIAPFADGNGRVAHAVIQILQAAHGRAPAALYERGRVDYPRFLDTLRAYDAGNATPFFDLLRRELGLEG